MSYATGRFTLSTTGLSTFAVGFQPTWARFRVAGKTSADAVTHLSLGGTDGTNQNCGSIFTDATGSSSFDVSTKVVSQYERVSGTITEVLAASFDSFVATGVKLNVSTANTGYRVTIECGT